MQRRGQAGLADDVGRAAGQLVAEKSRGGQRGRRNRRLRHRQSDPANRADRSRGVKIELFVRTRKGRFFSTSRRRNSAAPGSACSSRTRTPSMSSASTALPNARAQSLNSARPVTCFTTMFVPGDDVATAARPWQVPDMTPVHFFGSCPPSASTDARLRKPVVRHAARSRRSGRTSSRTDWRSASPPPAHRRRTRCSPSCGGRCRRIRYRPVGRHPAPLRPLWTRWVAAALRRDKAAHRAPRPRRMPPAGASTTCGRGWVTSGRRCSAARENVHMSSSLC